MLSITEYPYLHSFFDKSVSVYGPWLTQNSRVIYTDLRGRTDISTTAVKSFTSKIAHFVMTDPRIDFHNTFFVFDRRKAISNSLPEIVTQAWFPVDLAQLQGLNHQLDHAASDPVLNGKVLLDVSPYSNREVVFNDLPALHRRVTRDYLCRTFFSETQVWWSIDFIINIAAIYSIAAGERSVSALHLDMRTLMRIRLIFAVYFVSQCIRSTEGGRTGFAIDNTLSLIHSSFKTIVSGMLMDEMEVRELMGAFKSLLQKHDGGSAYTSGMTLDHVIMLMKSMGVNRLDGISVQALRAANQRLLSNPVESFAALEYPPMFAYGVLCALSAYSAGNIGFTMQKTTALKTAVNNLRTILARADLYPSDMIPADKSHTTRPTAAPAQIETQTTTTTTDMDDTFNPLAL